MYSQLNYATACMQNVKWALKTMNCWSWWVFFWSTHNRFMIDYHAYYIILHESKPPYLNIMRFQTVSASFYIKVTFTSLISTPLHGSFPSLAWALTPRSPLIVPLQTCKIPGIPAVFFLTNLFEWSLSMSTPASSTVQVSCQPILCFADKYVEFVAGCGEE